LGGIGRGEGRWEKKERGNEDRDSHHDRVRRASRACGRRVEVEVEVEGKWR